MKKDKKNLKIFLVIGLVGIGLFVTSQKSYYALIVALFGIYAIVTTSLDLLFGYTGQISLGHAGFFAIGAYVTALFSLRLGIPGFFSLIFGTCITGLVGALIAIPAARLIKHFLSLLMIAFGQVVYLIANSWTEVTGGSLGILNIPYLNIFGLEFDSNFKCVLLIWLFVMLVVVVKKRIICSKVGDAFIAIRENATAAKGVGINVRRYKVMAFAISAGMSGLAGGLYAFLRGFISPETFNGTQSLLFMTMLLFGGINSEEGPIIGAIILLLFKEVFQVFSAYQGLIYALFMLLVLFVFPNGLVGVFETVKKKMGKRRGNEEC